MVKHAVSQEQRATRRARLPEGRLQSWESSLTFLESEAVGPSSRADYTRRIEKMMTFFRNSKRKFTGTTLDIPVLLEILDVYFFEGRSVDEGKRLVAALKHHFPQFGVRGSVPTSRLDRALKGWSRHTLVKPRAPLPWHAATALIGFFVHQHWRQEALALAILFVCYMRPGELLALRGKNLIAPMPKSGVIAWTVIWRMSEYLVPTKTGCYDDSLAFDLPRHRWMNRHLLRLKCRTEDESPLWDFTGPSLVQKLHTAAQSLGLDALDVELYSFRHGGASADIMNRDRALDEVKKRLRHTTDTSTRRYEKAGRLANELRNIPESTRNFGAQVASIIDPLLFGDAQPPLLPGRCTTDCSTVSVKRAKLAL